MVGAPGRKSRDPSVTSEGEDLPAPHRCSPGRDVRKRNVETQMNRMKHNLLIPLPRFNKAPSAQRTRLQLALTVFLFF